MTISNLDGMINALANNSSRLVIDKASIANAAAGQFHSLWRATGQPGQGAIPIAAAANCNNTTLGAFNFTQQTSPMTSYLGYLEAVCSNSSVTMEIHDRLIHMGGLNGTLTTAQTVGIDFNNVTTDNMVERRGDSNFSDIMWWLEWYSDTGATVVTATVAVTYNDGTTGNLTGVSLAATRRASFMQPLNGLIPAASSGKYIRAVNSVTLSATTGTAGNFGVTATRLRGSVLCPLANMKWSADWAALPVSEVPNSSCLFMVQIAGTTSTGTVRGGGKIAHG
jgi:hypothetical protein